MEVTKKDLADMQVELTIEAPAEDWDKAITQAVNRINRNINIPGFRKGKAPRARVEQAVGMEYVINEAYEKFAPVVFNDALEQEKIVLGTYPQFSRVTAEQGKPLVFKAVVVPKPQVTLGEYKGIKAEKKPVEISEEEVTKHINLLRERKGELVAAEEGAAVVSGDMVTLDFKGFVDDEPFQGGEGKDYPLTIGSGRFIPGFEEQLIGLKVGDEKEVNVTFPEDYNNDKLAGRAAKFQCKINSIKHKNLPELNDDFVKTVSQFQTVDELTNDVKENLTRIAEAKAAQDREEEIVKQMTDNAKVDVPPAMIEDRVTQMINAFASRLESQGMKFERYLQYASTDIAKMRKEYRPQAESSVRTDLVLEEIAKQENILVTDDEVDAEIEAMAANYNTTAAQVKKIMKEQGSYPNLLDNIRRTKTAKFVIDNAVE